MVIDITDLNLQRLLIALSNYSSICSEEQHAEQNLFSKEDIVSIQAFIDGISPISRNQVQDEWGITPSFKCRWGVTLLLLKTTEGRVLANTLYYDHWHGRYQFFYALLNSFNLTDILIVNRRYTDSFMAENCYFGNDDNRKVLIRSLEKIIKQCLSRFLKYNSTIWTIDVNKFPKNIISEPKVIGKRVNESIISKELRSYALTEDIPINRAAAWYSFPNGELCFYKKQVWMVYSWCPIYAKAKFVWLRDLNLMSHEGVFLVEDPQNLMLLSQAAEDYYEYIFRSNIKIFRDHLILLETKNIHCWSKKMILINEVVLHLFPKLPIFTSIYKFIESLLLTHSIDSDQGFSHYSLAKLVKEIFDEQEISEFKRKYVFERLKSKQGIKKSSSTRTKKGTKPPKKKIEPISEYGSMKIKSDLAFFKSIDTFFDELFTYSFSLSKNKEMAQDLIHSMIIDQYEKWEQTIDDVRELKGLIYNVYKKELSHSYKMNRNSLVIDFLESDAGNFNVDDISL